MDNQVKTSFIPKRPIETSKDLVPPQKKGSAFRTFFSLISIFLFIASIVGLGGVYFYKFTIETRIENQVASLQEAKAEFDENFISVATRLNTRINQATELLNNHLSPSSLYALLEEYTLQSVSFSGFEFSDDLSGSIQISGAGEASRFESIVLQSDAFGRSGFMRNVIFTGLEPDLERNTVRFDFEATLDPRLVLYRNSLPESFDNTEN